jgi:hypothetical protein
MKEVERDDGEVYLTGTKERGCSCDFGLKVLACGSIDAKQREEASPPRRLPIASKLPAYLRIYMGPQFHYGSFP